MFFLKGRSSNYRQNSTFSLGFRKSLMRRRNQSMSPSLNWSVSRSITSVWRRTCRKLGRNSRIRIRTMKPPLMKIPNHPKRERGIRGHVRLGTRLKLSRKLQLQSSPSQRRPNAQRVKSENFEILFSGAPCGVSCSNDPPDFTPFTLIPKNYLIYLCFLLSFPSAIVNIWWSPINPIQWKIPKSQQIHVHTVVVPECFWGESGDRSLSYVWGNISEKHWCVTYRL